MFGFALALFFFPGVLSVVLKRHETPRLMKRVIFHKREKIDGIRMFMTCMDPCGLNNVFVSFCMSLSFSIMIKHRKRVNSFFSML